MPVFEREDVELYYEEHGTGFPVLLFAPGGMRSTIAAWQRSPIDPIAALRDRFRVIAMDQRNASGRSKATIRRTDGWQVYTEDHLALMDHLGIERFHALGMCIGGPYCLGVAQAAPQRVASAVLLQPIGLSSDNRELFYAMFDRWSDEMRRHQPQMDDEGFAAFRERMYGGDFVFNVDRGFVRSCQTPLLVLLGDDPYHPSSISRELVELAPNAELIERWKEPEASPDAAAQVARFLSSHTP